MGGTREPCCYKSLRECHSIRLCRHFGRLGSPLFNMVGEMSASRPPLEACKGIRPQNGTLNGCVRMAAVRTVSLSALPWSVVTAAVPPILLLHPQRVRHTLVHDFNRFNGRSNIPVCPTISQFKLSTIMSYFPIIFAFPLLRIRIGTHFWLWSNVATSGVGIKTRSSPSNMTCQRH